MKCIGVKARIKISLGYRIGEFRMKIAIMQPYFLPYIGYFQLIHAVDKFVVYDDVQYIKGGWINRNRVLINGTDSIFTLSLKKDAHRLNINQRLLSQKAAYDKRKLLKTIEIAYGKAPYYMPVKRLLEEILKDEEQNLARFVTNSLRIICRYLDITTPFYYASSIAKDEKLKGEERIIDISKAMGAEHYINPIGGVALYSKEKFLANDITLSFLKTKDVAKH